MNDRNAIRVAFRGHLGQFALDAAFTAPATGVTALYGPSGCGKTTVLRCIAGLQRLTESFCTIDGDIWQDGASFRPTHERSIGYVFQEASLFSHLSVRRNLLYGAKGARSTTKSTRVGFDEVADLLGLAALLGRSPLNLSGGERQRVAIGRALLSQPKLLLMDEPLSALDRRTRQEILPYLERLHERLSLPVIYVTHDMAEVERLADHLVLMDSGRVVALGSLSALQSDPSLSLVKDRDAAVSLDAMVEDYDAHYGLLTLAVAGGRFLLPAAAAAAGERRRLRVAAGDVSLSLELAAASTILNSLPARILSASAIGDHEMIVVLSLGLEEAGAKILARVTRRSWDRLGLIPGQSVHAQIKSVALAPDGGSQAGPN